MSAIFVTKCFRFSASFSSASKIHAHNYLLSVTLPAISFADEERFESAVEQRFISQIHTQDLSESVSFLKGKVITDSLLLSEFLPILQSLAPARITSLELSRGGRTTTRLEVMGDDREER